MNNANAVNQGEICPFCKIQTNPGSVVCHGCGAEREIVTGVLARIAIGVGIFFCTIVPFIAFLADNVGISVLSLIIGIGLCVVTCVRNKSYGWVRRS